MTERDPKPLSRGLSTTTEPHRLKSLATLGASRRTFGRRRISRSASKKLAFEERWNRCRAQQSIERDFSSLVVVARFAPPRPEPLSTFEKGRGGQAPCARLLSRRSQARERGETCSGSREREGAGVPFGSRERRMGRGSKKVRASKTRSASNFFLFSRPAATFFSTMGACASTPLVADDDDLLGGGLAPGPDHAIARFKNQDVAALATKYMPKEARTVSATTSSTLATTTMPAPAGAAPRLISSVPAPRSTFHHLPPLALGALGDNSLDDEPGARTVRLAPQGERRGKREREFNRALFRFRLPSLLNLSLSLSKKKKKNSKKKNSPAAPRRSPRRRSRRPRPLTSRATASCATHRPTSRLRACSLLAEEAPLKLRPRPRPRPPSRGNKRTTAPGDLPAAAPSSSPWDRVPWASLAPSAMPSAFGGRWRGRLGSL